VEEEEVMEDVEATGKKDMLGIFDIKEEEIVPTSRFVEDLGATSTDLVEMVATLQNTFDFGIDGSQVTRLQPVQSSVDFLKAANAVKHMTF
jgi:acyl carrier protein